MPFYADSQFNTPVLVPVIGIATVSLTGTGTAVTGVAAGSNYPVFLRRTAIKNIVVVPSTAPNGALLANLLFYNNGTLMGTVVVGTATAGQACSGAMTAANTFASMANPSVPTTITLTAVGTATSAGTAAGIYQIWLDQQELYS